MISEFVERRIQDNGQLVNFNIDRTQGFRDIEIRGQKTRIFGTEQQLDQFLNKKPDGSPVMQFPAGTTVSKGTAEKTTGKKEESAVNNISNGVGDVVPVSVSKHTRAGHHLPGLVANPMENFATVNHLFSLVVLTPKQYNNPSSYRTNSLDFISSGSQTIATGRVAMGQQDFVKLKSSVIFSSGGRGDAYRTQTASGSPEYYIDDFTMQSVIAANPKTGITNATSFNFTIFEPFSMGLLLQSLQVGAIEAGYLNYLDAPYLLKLDIKGWHENGSQISSVKPKYFCIKFKKVGFEVDESGSKYNVEAYPFSEQAFSDTVNTIWSNFSIKPASFGKGTVKEVLVESEKSLVKVLNDNEKRNVEAGKYSKPDIYEVVFPTESYDDPAPEAGTEQGTATVNPSAPPGRSVGGQTATTTTEVGSNPISEAGFGFASTYGGNYINPKQGDVRDEKTGRVNRGKMSIDPNSREFYFTQGQSITDVIQQVILGSTYCSDAVSKPENLTPEGFVKWFKVSVQVKLLDYDPVIGDFAKKYTFRIYPFKVHNSVFSNPQAAPIGYPELQKNICKKYEYIYTGQNVDIIDFKINFNNLFYAGSNPSPERSSQTNVTKNQQGTVAKEADKATAGEGATVEAAAGNLPKSKVKRDPNLLWQMKKGGFGYEDVKQKVAQSFHEAVIKGTSADLIMVDLEIMGDPYYMIDHGFNNYFSSKSGEQITEDGTANYEDQDVYIYIGWRTPEDIGTDGLMQFKNNKESPFSGIYRVVRCEHKISSNKFTQVLKCVRMQGQTLDYDEKFLAQSKADALQVKFSGEEKPKTTVAETPPVIQDTATLEDAFKDLARSLGIPESLLKAGPKGPQKPAEPEIQLRRRQSNGTIVNFNIDKTKPFVDEKLADGTIRRIFET